MSAKRTLLSAVLCSFWLLSGGCSKPAPPQASFFAAEKRFLEICREEFHYPIFTNSLNNTLWIYLPAEDSIIALAASPRQPAPAPSSSPAASLQHVKAKLSDGIFTIRYDILHTRKYSEDTGYSSVYSKKYQERQNNVFSAMSRAFPDGDEKQIPDFFVLVIADIANGIKTESIFYFRDFKKAMSIPPSLPQEEFAKRYLSRLRGDPSIVGDRTGKHLNLEEMTWSEFLARQLENRIRFKYQQSSFPPSDDNVGEILKIVAELVSAYDFQDFQSVRLEDLASGQTYLADKSQLEMNSK